jgi:hypothetical protein
MQIDTNVDEEVNFYKEKYKSDEVFEYLSKKYKVKSFSYLPYFKVHSFILEEVKKEESLFDKTSRKFYPSDEVLKSMQENIFKDKLENFVIKALEDQNILLKKKIENLHIALNKKTEKNKNQKEEITRLLKVNKSLEISEMNLIKIFDELSSCKKLINEKDTIIKYLEGRLDEK